MGNALNGRFWRTRSRTIGLCAVASGVALLSLIGLSPHMANATSAVPEETSIQVDAEKASNLGIEVTPALATEYRRATTGYGVVIGLETLAQAEADLMTAEAAAKTSGETLTRARKLLRVNAASQSTMDAAENQATADAARLALAQRRAIVVFGARPPWQTPEARADAMAQLTKGRTVLVRATFPMEKMTATPSELGVSRPLRDSSRAVWTTTAVWDAPADSSIPGRSLFALVRDSDLAQGERVIVSATQGNPITGVVVPATAVVVSESGTWCYVVVESNRFSRRAVDTRMAIGDGYFVPRGIAPGQHVVTAGAGLLLAHEMTPSESGE